MQPVPNAGDVQPLPNLQPVIKAGKLTTSEKFAKICKMPKAAKPGTGANMVNLVRSASALQKQACLLWTVKARSHFFVFCFTSYIAERYSKFRQQNLNFRSFHTADGSPNRSMRAAELQTGIYDTSFTVSCPCFLL